MEQWEERLTRSFTDPSTLPVEQLTIIEQMEQVSSVDDIIKEYKKYGENIIFRNLFRWKIMKNLCIRAPQLNFSNEVIEEAINRTLECPSDCIVKIKEWIDEKIDTKTLFNYGPFNAFVNTDRGIKNFWYILSEVANA